MIEIAPQSVNRISADANGTEQRKRHTPNRDTWSLIQEWRQFNGERTVFSTNSAGTTGEPQQKNKVGPPTSHHI